MKSERDDQEQPRSLAERVNSLFAMERRTDAHGRQREYSTAEVAKAVTTDPSHSTSCPGVIWPCSAIGRTPTQR
jgi:hypothetical protein